MTQDHFNEFGEIRSVVLRHARDAFCSPRQIASQWQALNYLSEPNLDAACEEYDTFAALIESVGATIRWLPADDRVMLDGIYVRDAAFPVPGGVVLCNMGKPQRENEPRVMAESLTAAGIPVMGFIEGEGRLEGGDIVWLDSQELSWAKDTEPTRRASGNLELFLDRMLTSGLCLCRTGLVRQMCFI